MKLEPLIILEIFLNFSDFELSLNSPIRFMRVKNAMEVYVMSKITLECNTKYCNSMKSRCNSVFLPCIVSFQIGLAA